MSPQPLSRARATPHQPPTAVHVVRPRELNERQVAAWRRLQEQGRAPRLQQWGSPFLAPEFAAAVGEVRRDALVAVVESDAISTSEAAGFLPFHRGRLGVGRAIGMGLSDCQDLVRDTRLALDPASLLRASGLTVWDFDHLADDPALLGSEAARVTSTHASPVIDISDGYPAYLAGLRERAPKFTRTTLAKERRLGRRSAVRYVHDERDPQALRTLLAWKSAQYRRTGRTDRFSRAWIVELVERLHQTTSPSFAGLLSVLYADEHPVAAHFGLRSDHTLACWFPAYDPAYAKYSPGLILHLRMAEGAAASGLRLLDLGRGAKEYKDSLKTEEFTVHEGYVTRRHPVAVAHQARRVPARFMRQAVVSHPALYEPADRALKRWGTLTARRRRNPHRSSHSGS